MNRRVIRRILSIAILVATAGLVGWYLIHNWSDFASIRLEQPWWLIPAVAVLLVNVYASGTFLEVAIEPHGVRLTRRVILGLAVLTRFSNQIAPSYAGASVRATYLKRTFGLPYATFSASFLVSNVLQLLISGAIAIALLGVVNANLDPAFTLSLAAAIVVVSVVAVLIPVRAIVRGLERLPARFPRLAKPVDRLVVFVEAYGQIRSHRMLLPRTILWVIVMVVAFAAFYFFLLAALGVPVGALDVLFMSALSSWSVVISLTPAGLGVREGVMVLSGQAVGIPVAVILVLAVLLRAVVFATTGLLSIYYTPRLMGRRRPRSDGGTGAESPEAPPEP